MQVQGLEPFQPLDPDPQLLECGRPRIQFQRMPERPSIPVASVDFEQAINSTTTISSQSLSNLSEEFAAGRRSRALRLIPQCPESR